MSTALLEDRRQSVAHAGVRLAGNADRVSSQAGALADILVSLGEHLSTAVQAGRSIAEDAAQAAAAARELRSTVAGSDRMAGALRKRIGALRDSGDAIAKTTEEIGAIAGSIRWIGLNTAIETARASGNGGEAIQAISHEVRDLAAATNTALAAIRGQVHRLAEIQTQLDEDAGRLAAGARSGAERSEVLSEALARQEANTAAAASALHGVQLQLGQASQRAADFSELGRSCTERIGQLLLATDEPGQRTGSVAAVAGHLCSARSHLVALMSGQGDPADNIDGIREHSDALETCLAPLVANGHPAADSLLATWRQFRETRDGHIVPHIQAGRIREAKELARGIQAKRIRSMMHDLLELTGGDEDEG